MNKKARQVAELARRISTGVENERGQLQRFRERFKELPPDQRIELFHWLSDEYEVAFESLEEPVSRVRHTAEEDRQTWNSAVRELRMAIASPRQRLIEGLISATGGMEFVFELRAEVLEAQRDGETGLEALEEDIAYLLNRWCQHGLLFLEEIHLGSSFETIRFLKDRELVHPMVGLEEMGHRLGEDRMCFALYHAAMPGDPVVFIEVALSLGLVHSIHEIIDDRKGAVPSTKSPDTAIFYSINNTQNGLAGLGLGKILLFRVTEALKERHPTVKTFATLSPIPGFWPRYLRPLLEGRDDRFKVKRDRFLKKFPAKSQLAITTRFAQSSGDADDFSCVLLGVLSNPGWITDVVYSRTLRKPLSELAYAYITEEKDARGRPLNPVAGFHLGNGAKVARSNINFAANTSSRGLDESCGLMVNYVYSQKALAPIGRAVRSLLPWGGRESG